eukprot:12158153-Alexandrium_andersonii.AAC.1
MQRGVSSVQLSCLVCGPSTVAHPDRLPKVGRPLTSTCADHLHGNNIPKTQPGVVIGSPAA